MAPGSAARQAPEFSAEGASRDSADAEVSQLSAGGDAGLGEDVAEVECDGARRDPAELSDVLVAHPLGDELGDAQLGGGELDEGGRVAFAGRLAGGAQLGSRPLGKGLGGEVTEGVEGLPQVFTRVDATSGTP